jgi:arylsulfatase A-like enzyme
VLLTLGACSPDEDAGPPVPPFPVRLLALPDAAGPPALLDDDLSDLSPWWLVDLAAGSLSGAEGHPSVTRDEDGAVHLAAGNMLVRVLEVPAKQTVVLTTRLATDEDPAVGALCPQATLALLGSLGHATDGHLVEGGIPADAPVRTEITTRALALMQNSPAVQESAWASLPDASGLARARVLQSARDEATLRAVLLGAPREGTRFASVSLRRRSQVARLHAGAKGEEVLDPESLADGPLALSLRISGERRPSLVVPAGHTASLRARIPTGATRLSAGLALRPGSQPGAAALWSLSLHSSDGYERNLGGGEVVHPANGPLVFEELSLPWPSDWIDAEAELRLTIVGDDALVLGQPLVHGNPTTGERSTQRPNLLFVSLDTVRADRLSLYGYERETSPALERFAATAVAFDDASSVGPYTLPTHATMFSGLLPLRHDVIDSGADRVNAAAMPWLPRLLSDAGWVTAAFTGGGFLSNDYGFAAGFDRFGIVDPIIHRESDYAQHRYARDIPPHLEAIEARAALASVSDWVEAQGDSPWFAFVHSYAAHDYLPPAEDLALFDTLPADSWGREWREVQTFLAPDGWTDGPLDPARVEHLSNLYDASIRFADRELGAFLDELEARGDLANTVVVITSDHGEEFGEHGGLKHSATLYQEMLHVPLLVRAPGVTGGRRVSEPVGLTDLVPTLLPLLGLPSLPDGSSDGRDLAPLLSGSGERLPPPVLLGHVHTLSSQRLSLRVGPHKVIHGLADDDGSVRFPATAPWELFDLSADDAEAQDLWARRGDQDAWIDRVADLEAELRSQAVEAGASEVGDAVLQQLRELGYIR